MLALSIAAPSSTSAHAGDPGSGRYGAAQRPAGEGSQVKPGGPSIAPAAPAGFSVQTVASGFNLPTAFAITPDGRMFVAEKSGVVRVWKDGAILPAPLIDISAIVNDYWDRGLLGMTLDPSFASNGYIYLLYAYEPTQTDDATAKTGRLSRYTVVGDTAAPATEKIILGTLGNAPCSQYPVGADCIPQDWYGHGVGSVRFGNDGTLFVTNGDDATWTGVDDPALRAQDIDSLAGKLIRVDANGKGLADNPFWNGNPDAARSKVWAYGLRNAFRFSVRPGSGNPGAVYAGEVGWNEVEEIDVIKKGNNLGWPCYEGAGIQAGYQFKTACQALYSAVLADPSKHTPPVYAYNHAGESASVTGGTFYMGSAYPPQYQGKYFFGDYVRSWLKFAGFDANDALSSGPADFDVGAEAAVDIQEGPDGRLYYVSITTGEIRRYVYGVTTTTYASDLAWSQATNGWGPAERDMSNGEQAAGDGVAIQLNGTAYTKGIGAHAASDIRFGVPSGCSTFASNVGMDDEVGANGAVVFEVYLDGAKAWDSGVMNGSSATKSVNLDVTGKSEVRLVVTEGGNGNAYDHADWADARFECGGGGDLGSPATFGPPTSLPAGLNTHSVVASDVDGDTMLDLVAANASDNSISVFAGNGDGTFDAGASFPVGTGTKPKNAIVADLDADGKPDVATANQDASTVSILKGNGNGTFGAPTQIASCQNAHEVAAADLNGDAKLDLAVACWGTTQTSVLLGNGNATFQPAVHYTAGSNPHSVVARDFNGDAKLDLAVANFGSANVSVFLGNGDGTFPAAVNYGTGTQPHSIRAGDLNGDGKLDLVTANAGANSVTVLRGTGTGTFTAGVAYATGLVPKSVAIADVNGNGTLDVVTANTAGNGDGVTGNPGGDRVSVLLGDGTGALGVPSEFLVGQTPFSVHLADVNGDGKPDIQTAEWDSNSVTVRLNTTSGAPPTFAVSSVSPPDGAAGVSATANVSAVFTSAVDPATLTSSTVKLELGGSPVPAALSYDGGTRTVTLDPAEALQNGATYTATVLGGPSGVKSTAGAELSSTRTWSFTVASGATGTIYISDLGWTSTSNGWGPAERDTSNGESGGSDGATITLNGTTFAKGVGAHATSDVRLAIPAGCQTFDTSVGVDDEVGPNGSVEFTVEVDGVSKYASGVMTGSTATKTASVDVTGKSELRLRLDPGGDGIDFDHGDWAGARFTCGSATNQAPVPTIASPTAATTFAVGNTIDFQGSAVDTEDGELTGSSLSWQINLYHCVGQTCHMHPFTSATGSTGSFVVPDHGDTFHFELTLTATDSDGASASTSVLVQPRTAQVTLATSPAGLQVVLGGSQGAAPFGATLVEGSTVGIGAPSPQGGLAFQSWSDGGAQQHTVTVGSTNVTYTATFADPTPPAITGVTPAESSSGASVSTNVTATFSEPMNPATINGTTMTLALSGTPVSATVTYNAGTRTATLDPASNLQLGGTYTATVVGGASGVKDVDGSPLAQSKTWTFTVGVIKYVSNLSWGQAVNGLGPAERDKSNGGAAAGDGKTITLNGTTFAKGVGAHARSDIRLQIPATCSTFRASVGVDDEVGSSGSVIFRVYGDAAKLYDSGKMTGSTATKTLSVGLTGRTVLTLIVTESNGGTANDHADWADARFACTS